MRCYGCNNILTRQEEEFNSLNPQLDKREFCMECLSFTRQGVIIQNYINEQLGEEYVDPETQG